MKKSGVKNKLTQEQLARIREKLTEILNYEPRIGVFGKTGAGKSSLCNALFGQDVCPIGDVEACTRNPQEVFLNMDEKGIKLVDVPGVGESQERDKEYGELYASLLPELDVVLWLLKGDDRAYASDEMFYENVVKPHIDQGKAFFFVVNQVDKIEPFREWDVDAHEPGDTQRANIDRKVSVISEEFGVPRSKVIAVSAAEQYNLTTLVDEIIYALPKEKKITVFREVNQNFRSAEAKQNVKKDFFDVAREVIEGIVGVGTIIGTAFEAWVNDAVGGVTDFFSGIADWFSDLFK